MKNYLLVLGVILIGIFLSFGIYYGVPFFKTEEVIKEENKPSDSVKDTTSATEEKKLKQQLLVLMPLVTVPLGKTLSLVMPAPLMNITINMALVIFLVKCKIYLLMMI